MYIITDVCNSLDGEILRIDLLSTQILLKRTLKKELCGGGGVQARETKANFLEEKRDLSEEY